MHDRRAVARQSSDIFFVQMNTVCSKKIGAQRAQARKAGGRPFAEMGDCVCDFLRGFLQMRVNGQAKFIGEREHAGKCGVADRVRRMRRESEREERLVGEFIANQKPGRDVGIGI